MASFSTFSDPLTSNSQNTSLWTSNFGTLSWSGGGFTITNPANYTGYGGQTSVNSYDLTGTSCYVQMMSVGNQALSSIETIPLQLNDSGGTNKLFWYINNGTLHVYKTVSGTQTSLKSSTYSSIGSPLWFRIRESSGTTYFDYSNDGRAWTNYTSLLNPINVTALFVNPSLGTYSNESTATLAKWLSFNTPPTTPASTTTAAPVVQGFAGHATPKTRTTIQILDASLTTITTVHEFIPLRAGILFQYSKELSDFGQCKFRISSYDTMFKDFGDILQPHQNHVRIYRNNALVWSGAIIENSKRTMDYIEVVAAEYEWYLSKILVERSGSDPLGTFPTNPPGSTFNSTPTGATIGGTNNSLVTYTFNTTIPFPMSIGQTLTFSGFNAGGNTNLDGTWGITAFTTNTVTVLTSGGSASGGTMQPIAFSNNIYRIFNNGTMGSQVTNIMNETITTMKGVSGVHPLANMTLGEIDTPNYPPNTTNANNPPSALSGPYIFGNGIAAPLMQFDFHTILYILKSFGAVSYADFGIDENLVFTFKSFFGNDKHYDVNFTWGDHGNAVDFNWPRLGQMMANDLLGIATDIQGNILHFEQTDQSSITASGLIQAVAAYADIKDQATLNARIQAELPLISKPDESPITFTLNEKAAPFGVYDIGDIITCTVNHKFLTISAVKRIVGITVAVNDQGRESITVQLNTPLPSQYGSTGQN